ncbi:MAG: hypothetical protein LBH81_03950 [Rickettsiales bacterium]|jgi:hypothetical protein|nr:hypothetical protein [Rickettsiales bacterium]
MAKQTKKLIQFIGFLLSVWLFGRGANGYSGESTDVPGVCKGYICSDTPWTDKCDCDNYGRNCKEPEYKDFGPDTNDWKCTQGKGRYGVAYWSAC